MNQLHPALKLGPPENRTYFGTLEPAQTEKCAISPDFNDFTREVYGVLGIPIDAVQMADVVRQLESAAAAGLPFLMSTPNLNFLIGCQSDMEFRESLLKSDLCTADGMPVVWIARLLGIPIRSRVAGSDIFEALKTRRSSTGPLKLFLFGGDEGIAERACETLRDEQGGMRCVGFHYPGFGSLGEMSTDGIIEKINASQADILAVSLGAQKGQAWLLRNHDRLRIPVRSHLGATINFQAGAIRRSPVTLRRFGMEWLWRIKEEPTLRQRYLKDGYALLRIMLLRVLPLIVVGYWHKLARWSVKPEFAISQSNNSETLTLKLHGDATEPFVQIAVGHFRASVGGKRKVKIDFSNIRELDSRFIGCLLMLRKQLVRQSQSLEFVGIPPRIKAIFRRNGFGYLLTASA